eukprot:s197_g29.t1
MGSGASSSLADATAQQLRAVAAELSPEQQQKLRSAVEILELEPGLSLRSVLSGEVVKVQASKDWTYRELSQALQGKLQRQKVVKFHRDAEVMDEYSSLEDLGIDVTGELLFSLSDLPPALLEASAEEALGRIQKSDILELKAMARPYRASQRCLEAVALLLQKPSHDWQELKQLLTPQLLQQVQAIDTVSDEVLVQLQWYIKHPDCEMDKIKHTTSACVVGLWHWVLAVNADGLAKRQKAAED